MAGQTIINFDGLSGEAAEKLAKGLAEATKVKIDGLLSTRDKLNSMSMEDVTKLEKILGSGLMAGGQCGVGCT